MKIIATGMPEMWGDFKNIQITVIYSTGFVTKVCVGANQKTHFAGYDRWNVAIIDPIILANFN